MYYYLKKIDLFDKRVHLRINRQSTLNTVEGVFCSLIFYVFSFAILCYNLLSTYLQNTPIIAGTQLIRDLSAYENIPKRSLKLTLGYYTLDSQDYSLHLYKNSDLAKFKEESYLYSTLIQSSPFLIERNISAEMGYCDPEEYGNEIDANHVTCYSLDKEFYQIGGSTYQTGATIGIGAVINVPVCELSEVTSDSSEVKSTENICTQSGGNPTDSFIIGLNYSSDYVDIDNAIGYKSYILSSYMILDYTRQSLNVEFKLIKAIIETDPNYLYSFEPKKTTTFYETVISYSVVEKDSIDYNVNINLTYTIDYKLNMTYRSYNKVDNALASCFSMIEVFFVCFETFVHIMTKTAVEFEIINQMYYVTPKQQKNLIVEGIDSKGRRISLVKNNINRLTGNLIPPNQLKNSKNLSKYPSQSLNSPENPNIANINDTDNIINYQNSFSSYSNSEYSSTSTPNNEIITVYRENKNSDENNSNIGNHIKNSIQEVHEYDDNNQLNKIDNDNADTAVIRKKKTNKSSILKTQCKTKIELDNTFEIPSDNNDSYIFKDNSKDIKDATPTIIDNFKLKLPKIKIKQVQSHTINPSALVSNNNLNTIRLANTNINSGRLTLLDSSLKTKIDNDNSSEVNLNIKNNLNITDGSKISKFSKQSNISNFDFERLHPDIVKSKRNYFVNQKALTIDPLGELDKKINSINNVKRLHLKTGCVSFFTTKCCSTYNKKN